MTRLDVRFVPNNPSEFYRKACMSLMRPKSRTHILERLENGDWDILGDIK